MAEWTPGAVALTDKILKEIGGDPHTLRDEVLERADAMDADIPAEERIRASVADMERLQRFDEFFDRGTIRSRAGLTTAQRAKYIHDQGVEKYLALPTE